MVNSLEFIGRLEELLAHYELSASAFADKIGVQRSSISHLLSGRNKPSLEFVMKVIEHFPEVNLYWLLNGKGSFPSKPKSHVPDRPGSGQAQASAKAIERIVVFYRDGSFDSYSNLEE